MTASPSNPHQGNGLHSPSSCCFPFARRLPRVIAPLNSNSNTSQLRHVPPVLSEAKRQAQSLVDKGKELYKNDQDEQAVETFKQAIQNDPDNAEAHLRLGMAMRALEQEE